MRISTHAALAAALLACAPLSAQIRVPGDPAARRGDLPGSIPTAVIPAPGDIDALRLEDRWREENGISGPHRFGIPVPTDAGLENAGRWDVTEEGELVWRLRIESPGAKSLGIEFDAYRMPPGAQLFLYDEDLSNVFGAYDASQHNPDGSFVIEPFPGERAILEYKQPADLAEVGDVHISRVIHDYRDVFALERALDQAEAGAEGGITGGCTVGANCPQFDAYELQKRATVRTVYGGGLCSGSLINNTANDGTRYVYTAYHCSQGSTTVFRFNYEQSGCETGFAPTNQNVSGATLLASHAGSDGRLLRINPGIPAGYQPFYNGWRRSTGNPTFALSFHHPSGSPKAGSIDSNGGGKSTGFFSFGAVKVWSVNFQTGGTQGGSSGGPLFDQNLRTIGCLSGGPVGSCTSKLYGRFYEFWNASNIAQYLDPLGTGQSSIDGFDPSGGPIPSGFQFTSVSPETVDSVPVDGVEVVLNGSGFDDVTTVKVDGVELSSGFPPSWIRDSNNKITIVNWPLLSVLGQVPITVETATESSTRNINVFAPLSPTLDVSPSSPDFVFTAVPVEVRVGATPGSIVFNTLSPELIPTSLPGIVELDIGNSFTTLVPLDAPTTGSGGHAISSFSLAGVPPGKTFYWQSGVYNTFLVPGGFPLLTTNVQSTTVLF